MLGIDQAALTENQRPLHRVAQLAYVPRPGVGQELLARLARDSRRRPPSDRWSQLAEEILEQRQDVVPALPQRRQVDREHVQPIVQILAERDRKSTRLNS